MKKGLMFFMAVAVLMIFALPGSSFAAAGDLDTTFDTDGAAVYDSGDDDHGRAVAIQADGKIVVSGYNDNGLDNDVVVLRYDSDGTLDTTFDTDGVAVYDNGDDDYGSAVAIQADGKIVVSGQSRNAADFDVLVLRYDSDGTLDTAFDTDGVAVYDNGVVDYGNAVAIQADGKIVVSGWSYNGTDWDVLVLRYNSDGTLDTTFDTDGVALYDSGNDDNGTAVAIQANGKIVVAGESNNGTDYDVAVFRFCHPFRRR